jgi:DNA gyrase/topoisomerase IV subunit A
MKNCIPSLYADYGRYIDEFRAIPYYLDCLKPVERRLLLTLHDVAKHKLVKAAKVIGFLIGNFHPHGDLSAYGSLVKLVQRGLAIGQGNWGLNAYDTTSAAAMRYPEVQASQSVELLCFELVNYTVPWNDPENLGELQPIFLPSPIPIGLIGSDIIQGISFNITKIPRYTFADLTHRLIDILNKKIDPTIIPKTIIPNITNCDVYEYQPGDFERILTIGEGSIKIIPKMTIKGDGVYIHGRPPAGFTNLKNEIEKLEDKNEKCIYRVIDLSSKGNIKILIQPTDMKLYNQSFIDYIFKLLLTNVHFTCKFIDENRIVNVKSIDEILESTYNVWVTAYYNKLQSDKIKKEQRIYELQIIAVIKEIISNNKIQTMSDLINLYNSTYFQIYPNITEKTFKEVCSKHHIQKLLDYNTDITETMISLNDIINIMSNISVSAYTKFIEIYNSIVK